MKSLFAPHSTGRRSVRTLWVSAALLVLVLLATPQAHCLPQLLGDLDEDGQPTVLDIVRIVNHINGAPRLSASMAVFADVNQDGTVNEIDVNIVGDAILGLRSLAELPLARIRETSPANGATSVAVTRETIFRFTQPLATNSYIGTTHLYAEFGGRRILSRPEFSTDRRTLTLFHLEPLPAGARVRVTLNPFGLQDFLGRFVDLDGDGQPGGIAVLDFDTLGTTPISGTAMIGTVFASESIPGTTATNFVNRPLGGVTIRVDGMEESLSTVTDSNGFFRLSPCPAGEFFVHIDGRTLTNVATGIRYPDLAYYPSVGKAWTAAPGRTNNLAGGTGLIYLPLITQGTLKPVSVTTDTIVTFPPSVLSNNPALAGVSLVVPANSLFSDNGTRGGKVGIAAVPPDRLPGPLPAGLEFPLVITVQTDGGKNFDRPVPACFPNLPDPGMGQLPPPGTKNWLYSFNHDTGEWEAVGPMTVSEDGMTICTDPGVGILQPGWHGSGPPPTGPTPCESQCCFAGGSGGGPPPNFSAPNAARSAAFLPAGDNQFSECRPESDCQTIQDCFKRTEATYKARIRECVRNKKSCYIDSIPDEALEIIGNGLALIPWAVALIKCDLKYSQCLKDAKADHDRELNECTCAGGRLLNAVELSQLGGIDTLDASEAWLMGLEAKLDEISAINASIPTHPTTNEVINAYHAIRAVLADIDSYVGGNLDPVLVRQIESFEEEARKAEGVFGEPITQKLSHGTWVFAEVRTGRRVLEIRSKIDARGNYQLFLPRDSRLQGVSFYDPVMQKFGMVQPRALPTEYLLPRVNLHSIADLSDDTDADGLPDAVEFVLGTDSLNPDSDGDGVPDGAELDNGTDPLDGLPVATGIIASSDTPGTAVDVCAVNDIAIVADSQAGVTVFNVSSLFKPVRIAQVDTPGTALGVACSGNLVAVADGAAGLAIVDITDPPAARIVRQVSANELGGGSAQAVASAADLAFVGTTSSNVCVVELGTGLILQIVTLSGPVQDLAIEGTTLYAYVSGRLHVLPFASGVIQPAGSVTSPEASGINAAHGRGRLFVGNGIAYPVHTRGYNTISVSNAAAPSLIAAGTTAQFGWKQLVLNGSGFGIATVSPNQAFDGPHDVWLYDTSNPMVVTNFLTRLDTPGIARSVALYNGLGYVADHAHGLQVVNYLAYDALGQAPTGSLVTSSTNGTISGGGLIVLRAVVQDDVQVRNVEFFVNGQRLALDGSFPFEVVYRVPTNFNGTSVTFSATLSDTGGNRTSVTPALLNVVPDTRPPVLAINSPADNSQWFLYDDPPVRVTALDSDGVASIVFLLNGTPVPVPRISFIDYQIASVLPLGTNLLTAIATDYASLSSTSTVRIIVRPQVVSREISLFHFDSPEIKDTVSREISLFRFDSDQITEAVSREISLFRFDSPEATDAISREISVLRMTNAPAFAPGSAGLRATGLGEIKP